MLEKERECLVKIRKQNNYFNHSVVDIVKLINQFITKSNLYYMNWSRSYIQYVHFSMYQASLLLAKQFMNKVSNTITSSDSNFYMYIRSSKYYLKTLSIT